MKFDDSSFNHRPRILTMLDYFGKKVKLPDYVQTNLKKAEAKYKNSSIGKMKRAQGQWCQDVVNIFAQYILKETKMDPQKISDQWTDQIRKMKEPGGTGYYVRAYDMNRIGSHDMILKKKYTDKVKFTNVRFLSALICDGLWLESAPCTAHWGN